MLYGAVRSSLAHFLRHLELAFSTLRFFDFFHVVLPPFTSGDFSCRYNRDSGNYEAVATTLEVFPNLRRLDLAFRSTIFRGDSPWETWRRRKSPDNLNLDYEDFNLSEFPCQKTLIDYIMVFAHPYLHNLKQVHLFGFLKTTTKTKWEARLNEPNPETRNAVAAQVETEKQAILALHPTAVPPTCYCAQSCESKLVEKITVHRRTAIACEHYEIGQCTLCLTQPRRRDFLKAYHQYEFDFDDTAALTNPNLIDFPSECDELGMMLWE